ncbi:hypothetical protein SRHO_G00038850 [Serrasalmus rhombeus]
MCTVDGRSVLCNAGYEDRVSVCGNSMVLKVVVSADSGVYTVREVNNGAALMRTVLVTIKRSGPAPSQTVNSHGSATLPCSERCSGEGGIDNP